jgi:hypothetical protein
MATRLLIKESAEIGSVAAREAVEASIRASVREGAELTASRAAADAFQFATEKGVGTAVRKATTEAAEDAARAAVLRGSRESVETATRGLASKVVSKTLKSELNSTVKIISKSAKSSIGEIGEKAFLKSKQFVEGTGKIIMKNPKIALAFGTASALGGYALNKYYKNNNFKLKITKMEKNVGLFVNQPQILQITVSPVYGDMITLSTDGAIKFVSSNSSPLLNNFQFPITKIFSSGTQFNIDISSFPDFKNLKLSDSSTGEVVYKTSFDAEIGVAIKDTVGQTGVVIKEVLDSVAEGLGIDPYILKYIIIFILIVVCGFLLRPILSMLYTNDSSLPNVSSTPSSG